MNRSAMLRISPILQHREPLIIFLLVDLAFGEALGEDVLRRISPHLPRPGLPRPAAPPMPVPGTAKNKQEYQDENENPKPRKVKWVIAHKVI